MWHVGLWRDTEGSSAYNFLCSTYVECLEMTYGNMMAGAGCTMGGRLEGGLGGLFGAWAGNVE